MVEPEAVALIGPTVLVHKLLGPTADYIGEGIRDWTERRFENVQRVVRSAADKFEDGELDIPGTVPPRALRAVLREGQFAEDEVMADYLGGVLASSSGRDDRGAALTALIGRLSVYQLRFHYLAYSNARRLLAGRHVNLGLSSVRQTDGRYFKPLTDLARGMDFDAQERLEYSALTVHALLGLCREGLLSDWYMFGHPHELVRLAPGRAFTEAGILCERRFRESNCSSQRMAGVAATTTSSSTLRHGGSDASH